MQVDESIVVDGNAHRGSNQLILDVGFKGASIDPVQSNIILIAEHGEGWVHQLLNHRLEVLFADATFVNGWLTLELD